MLLDGDVNESVLMPDLHKARPLLTHRLYCLSHIYLALVAYSFNTIKTTTATHSTDEVRRTRFYTYS
jgi:hypothetical protein